MDNLHYTQRLILLELAKSHSVRFGEFKLLDDADVEKDSLNYHLQALIKRKFVEKVENAEYTISNRGKEYVNELDFEKKVIEKTPKITVFTAIYRKKDGRTEILLAKRRKAPFLGQFSLITGKIHIGETLEEAVKREVYEETNLKVNSSTFMGINRAIDTDPDSGRVLLDIFFMMFEVWDFEGELEELTDENENVWIDVEEAGKIDSLPVCNRFLTNDYGDKKGLVFEEYKFSTGMY